MTELAWRENVLPLPDHDLAWYERGSGPTVIALSGGPGDDHSYLRPVVEPLASGSRWILYDQRGTGHSTLEKLDEATLHPHRLVEDIEALRLHLGGERVRLVGHSWGANLALLYSALYPASVDRVALVGLGPLNEEFSRVAAANLMKPLSRAERSEYSLLNEKLKAALDEENLEAIADLHARRIVLFARGAFLSPEKAELFVEEYLAADSHRKLNHRVNQIVSAAYRKLAIIDGLHNVAAPLLVLYGYQDFEPITQAYLLRDHISHTRICFLNRCGHEPWREAPDEFYHELGDFLGEESAHN